VSASTPLPFSVSPPSIVGNVELGTKRVPPTVVVCLAILYVVWGSTYLALRYVVEVMPALFAGAVRYVAAGAVLYAVLRARGASRPSARQWAMATLAGAGTFLIGNGCVAWAEKSVASGLAAIVCATTPLWLTLMTAVTGARPGRRELLGLLIGFAGVVVAMWQSLSVAGTGALVLALAPVGWAAGSLVARRGVSADAGLGAAMQMIGGGGLMFGASAIMGEPPRLAADPVAIGSLIYLGVMGSIVAFSAYTYLLRNTSPAVATSYAYVNPFVALGLGAAVGGEALGPEAALGCVLAVVGVALVLIKPSARGAGAKLSAR
jgi:drug/metabolite transporter (DMT)-like permease